MRHIASKILYALDRGKKGEVALVVVEWQETRFSDGRVMTAERGCCPCVFVWVLR